MCFALPFIRREVRDNHTLLPAALDARTIEMTKQLKITIEIIPLDIGPESPLTGHVSNCWKSPPRTAPKNAIAATFRVIRFLLKSYSVFRNSKKRGGPHHHDLRQVSHLGS